MVNLEWYRTFKAIYQNGNLTRAAEELLISQPNVSIQLASLESYVGHKLFNRLPRKLVPTPYGEILYTQIVGAIENLENVEIEFRKSALERQKSIRIGSPLEYAQNILLDKLGNSEYNISFTFDIAKSLISKLENKEIDFAIATQKIEKEGLTYIPLVTENFMIIAHSSLDTTELEEHIKNQAWDSAEKWLLQQRWIVYDSKLSILRRFWREKFDKRPLIKPHFVIPDFNMIIKAVNMNYGIAVVSDLFIDNNLKDQQEVKKIWEGSDEISNQLWIAYSSNYLDESIIKDIKALAKDLQNNSL